MSKGKMPDKPDGEIQDFFDEIWCDEDRNCVWYYGENGQLAQEKLKEIIKKQRAEAAVNELKKVPNHTVVNLYIRERIDQLINQQTKDKE